MNDNSILLISTPNSDYYKDNNQFHLKELNFIEFKTFLENHFEFVDFYFQNLYSCSYITMHKQKQIVRESHLPLNSANICFNPSDPSGGLDFEQFEFYKQSVDAYK